MARSSTSTSATAKSGSSTTARMPTSAKSWSRLASLRTILCWAFNPRNCGHWPASASAENGFTPPREPTMSRVVEQYRRACEYLAGGVSSSTRLNRALGHPLLIDRAEGCRVWDLDGRQYLDLCC